MPYWLTQVLNATNIIAGIIGVIRFRKISKSYHPFLILIWIGILNDLLSIVLIHYFRSNTLNSNIYTPVDFFLIMIVFRTWWLKKAPADILIVVGILGWAADNLLFHSITQFNALFRIFYSFVITALSINELNKVFFTEKKSLFKNAKFIICMGFILFYSYRAAFEIFYYVNVRFSDAFYNNLFYILIYVNAVTNLIFALALLCIPTKRKFITTY